MWPCLTFLLVMQAGASQGVSLPPVQALMQRVDPERYVLGPGDVLLLTITGPVSESHQLQVGPDGRVVIPVLGPFEVAGGTISQFEAKVEKVLPYFYKEAKLTIQLVGLRTVKIYILGEVEKPGIYAVPALTRLSEAVSQAALPRAPLQEGQRPTLIVPGIAPTGSHRRVELRGGKVFKIDLFKVLREGRVDLDPVVEGGDVIFVPLRGRLVTIQGEVFSPGTYELLPEEGLFDLIRMAGGFLPTASEANIRIERRVGETRKLIFSGEEALKEPLQDGDLVVVPSVEEFRGEIEVKGAVRKPGEYKLSEGMTVEDLVRLAGGLTPKAIPERAYILRPEKGETKLIFLGQLETNFALKDGDTLTIPAIEEIQGHIEIKGAVRKPGKYPLTAGMTMGDLVELAGGLLPDAAPARATVTRPEPGREEKALIALKPEQLTREARGPFLLHDGDVVNIPSLSEVIGMVKARGELRKVKQMEAQGAASAGGQGQPPAVAEFETELREGLRVSDLVILAGGLTPEAAPQHAYIERVGPGDKKEMVRVNLTEALERPDSKGNVPLKVGDVLVVPPLLNFQDRVVVIGEVQGKNLEHLPVTGLPGQAEEGQRGVLYGVYVLRRGETLKDVILSVGGLTAKADPFNAYIERADPKGGVKKIEVDLFKLLVLGDESENLALQNGDRIVVPAIEDRVYIMGEVREPGAFLYRPRATIADYIGEAGGFTERARPSKGLLIRTEGGKRVAMQVNMGRALRGAEKEDRLYVKPGDIIVIPRTEFKGWKDVVELLNSLAVAGFYVGRVFR